MDAGINNVIYMELNSGPKMVNSTCGKTIVAGTIDRGSTVPVTQRTITVIKLTKLKKTVKFALQHAIKAQRGNRCIVSVFL